MTTKNSSGPLPGDVHASGDYPQHAATSVDRDPASESATATATTPPPQPGVESRAGDTTTRSGRALDALARYGVLYFLVLMIVGFSIWQPSRFATLENLQNVLSDQAIPAILALAVLMPLAAGEFDLSAGANLGFVAIFAAWGGAQGIPVPLLLVLCLAIGALIGSVNAFFVVRIGVNAFVATLAAGTILTGLNLLVTNGAVLFKDIPAGLLSIAQTTFIGLPLTVWIAALLAVAVWYLLELTPFGRYIRATGSGREAARLSGVKTSQVLASSFIIAGTLAGLAGFLQTARIGSANPSGGPEFLLPAYAAGFLGATVISRGLFNVWGTIIGVLVLAVGISGLTLAGAPFWLPNVFNGVALLVAVSLSVVVARKRGANG